MFCLGNSNDAGKVHSLHQEIKMNFYQVSLQPLLQPKSHSSVKGKMSVWGGRGDGNRMGWTHLSGKEGAKEAKDIRKSVGVTTSAQLLIAACFHLL